MGSKLLNAKGSPCPTCKPKEARKSTDGHHILPLEFGGRADGDMIYLCASCHHELHVLEKKAAVGELNILDISVSHGQRMAMLVRKALEQRMTHTALKSEGVDIADEARRRLVVHLTEEEQKRVKFLKNHFGYTNQETMMKDLINKTFQKITGQP